MFTKTEDGRVVFNDVSKITDRQLELMYNRVRYLTYDFHSKEELKAFFGEGHPLQEDISLAVLSVLGRRQFFRPYTDKRKEYYRQCALKAYRPTHEWRLAGYILSDGTMLNFSYDGYIRTEDHREVKSFVRKPRMIDDNSFNNCAMIEFINCGNIRVSSDGFEVSSRLTYDQKDTIRKYMPCDGYHYVDIMNFQGRAAKKFTYDEWNPERMFNDINQYFDSIAM